MSRASPRLLLAGLGLACAASVAAALVGQHRFGMEPCPWCILQRMLFIALALVSLLAAAVPSGNLRRALSTLGLPLAASGMAAALWQHFVAAQSASCALTLADKVIGFFGLDVLMPEVFEVRASCADAAVKVLGVPFELWSLALFAIAGTVLLISVLTPARRA
jgi:disulfide bond formation protein DsbB